ncbi:MAG TPA: four helix bundle protein [Elainellaceae cyanobacterium]
MNDKFLVSYRELRVYQSAIEGALQVFELSHSFPDEERDQLTRALVQATRLVCVYIAQAWLRRRYSSAFVARLNHAEAEAAAAQVWIEFAVFCHYLDAETGQELHHQYWEVLSDLDRLIDNSAAWIDPV